jgi:hypothetical protein
MKPDEGARYPSTAGHVQNRLTGIVTDSMLKDCSPGEATALDTWGC